MKNPLTSETFYKIIKAIADFLVNASEELVKQWLGTAIGQRFLKWFIDILVKKFFDDIVEPVVRVGIIKVGYYYDVRDGKNKIKRLVEAHESENEDLYYSTLNDIRRKL